MNLVTSGNDPKRKKNILEGGFHPRGGPKKTVALDNLPLAALEMSRIRNDDLNQT